jgi:hypothetical protein
MPIILFKKNRLGISPRRFAFIPIFVFSKQLKRLGRYLVGKAFNRIDKDF